jgi:hypothetical protein
MREREMRKRDRERTRKRNMKRKRKRDLSTCLFVHWTLILPQNHIRKQNPNEQKQFLKNDEVCG